MYNILVIEDHADTRKWLVSLANESFPASMISAAPTLAEARKYSSNNKFNIAIVDIGLPDGSGIDFIKELSASSPETYCIVATIYDDNKHIFGALQAGARGYLLKDQPRSKLVNQLQGVLHGDPPLSPSIARRIMQHFKLSQDSKQNSPLTDRERDILTLVAKGYRRSEIAEHLSISTHTVAGHIKNIYKKLNISSQAEAALEAVRLGLTESTEGY